MSEGARVRSDKQQAIDEVFEVFHAEYPPTAPWNQTIWRKEMGILKRTLVAQNNTYQEIKDAIRYAKMRGRKVYSLGYIPYIIEESKQYWTRLREMETQQNERMKEVQQCVVVDTSHQATSGPGWLNGGQFEEVD